METLNGKGLMLEHLYTQPVDRWFAWQRERHAELAGENSWLGLVGLFWLKPGRNRVGSGLDAVVQLPAGPARFGDIEWAGGQLLWWPENGDVIELQTDSHGPATTVTVEHLAFFVVDREGQLAVRVRDRRWADRLPFHGLDYFAYDPAWCLEAVWLLLDMPVRMEVPNVSGELKLVDVSYQATFERAGQRIKLLPMAVGDNEIFFIFRDQTCGRESYGAGRFLKVPAANDGKIQLDFNFAFNPPCAFTHFATCPLPPAENCWHFAVTAGEKSPKFVEN